MPAANDSASNGSAGAGNGWTQVDAKPYDDHHKAFKSAGQPQTEEAWLARAAEVSQIFAKDAAQRDIDNVSPFAEVGLLKSSGLLKVLGPKAHGGGGQDWSVGYKVIREVAKGDG